ILDVGAVWPIDPSGMKPFSFPNLTSSTYEVVMRCESRIFQSLSVNPSMIPQQTGGKEKKHSQAEIANAQQVDILTTSDAATNVEDGILTPLMQHYADLDYQHRSKEITVQKFGELGVKADMEKIKPLQNTNRYWIKWFGVESSRNAAQVQQQIAFMGTLMQIPPDKYPGYELNIAPIIVGACENIFGDRRARLIFKDPKEQQTVPPEVENGLLAQGFEVLVHTSDDDGKHMQVHAQAPPSMQRDAHMKRHQIQADLKQKVELMAKVAAAQAAGGQGGGGRPPQPGAQPAGRKQGKQRPGGIRPDSMTKAGAVPMPRRTG
ncbi:MAG TPA: hypothetical protein VNG04_09390, partial [Candidatus Acidoferrum sp.]|nr:hypothetical protein [Candidatus Acidoferrum sp.]